MGTPLPLKLLLMTYDKYPMAHYQIGTLNQKVRSAQKNILNSMFSLLELPRHLGKVCFKIVLVKQNMRLTYFLPLTTLSLSSKC